ncbi:MAG: 23S rRNA (adenine(2503)-C(2))-methyltransferase RlmN [Endomicrobium sp.]|nr:23S rRNA (adenine(2503)-C(2))-methyltransferase RlmN [Endomicrobium sp.]
MKKYILDLTNAQFRSTIKSVIEKDYEVDQILEWVYSKKVASFEEFTNISKDLRRDLDKRFLLRVLKMVEKKKSIIDGTIKYTFQTIDDKYFFAVFLPGKNRNSVCVSSQIGCPVMCTFCSSGKFKFARNLTRGEMIEQILQIENDIDEKVSRVLFMGIGEPTLNLNNITSVLNSLLSSKEFAIGRRHITLSSIGIVSAIKKLADADFGIRLAISLHSVDEKQRKKLIPNNFGFKIENILNAGKYYIKKTKSRLTIEYILIKGINDSVIVAHKFARLLRYHELLDSNVQVNLIPFNPVSGTGFQTPKWETVQKFKNILKFNGFKTNIRKAKGIDINAACGQLAY